MMSDKMKQRHNLMRGNVGSKEMPSGSIINPQRKQELNSEATTPLARPLHNHKKYQRLGLQNTAKSEVKVVHRNHLWLYTGANARTWFEEQNTYLTYSTDGCDSQAYYTN